MSIKVMSWVWENGPKDPTERLVLLALADHADDAGKAFPSMAGIGAKACVTERGARGIMRRLEAEGWVKTQVGGGRGGKSKYAINLARNTERETGNAKPGIANPETDDRKPGTYVPPNHQEPSSKEERDANASPKKAAAEVVTEGPAEKPEPKARLPAGWVLDEAGWAYARSKNIPDKDIEDEARGFHAYWSDRSDRDARKSARGWASTWEGWCRRISGRYRGMAGKQGAIFGGYGTSIAAIAARRRSDA